jgi:nucleotide-binding universal stress UspA family protein
MKVVRILAATDFSPAGDRAVAEAARIARQEHAELRVIHVAPPKSVLGQSWGIPEQRTRGIYRQATEALQQVAARIDPRRESAVSTGLCVGRAGRKVLEAAREFSADLLVIGARGEHDLPEQRHALGGTASRIAHATTIPLLLVRQAASDAARPLALAAVDLGAQSREIVQWAIKLARGGVAHVFHAYEPPFTRRLQAYGLARETITVYSQDEQTRRANELAALCAFCPIETTVQPTLERGEAAAAVLQQAERLHANLVVIGKCDATTRGARATAYGSACRSIASFATTNVLIVPRKPGAHK